VRVKNAGLTLLLACVMGLVWSMPANAGQKIRMYKINSKLQQTKIVLGGAVKDAGCHNLVWGKHVYRFTQIGYAWCSVFTEQDCAADSRVIAYWAEGKYKRYNIDSTQPQDKLYPGSKWIVDSAADDIQSWYCEAK
jgi:hypothetical protein